MTLDEAKQILEKAGYLVEDTDDNVKEIIEALTNNGWKFLKRQSDLKLIKLSFVSKKLIDF